MDPIKVKFFFFNFQYVYSAEWYTLTWLTVVPLIVRPL